MADNQNHKPSDAKVNEEKKGVLPEPKTSEQQKSDMNKDKSATDNAAKKTA